MSDLLQQNPAADGAVEAAFAEAAESLTAAWGRPVDETRCLTWGLPGGAAKLILWPVYGFVELAAFRADAQESWFLSRPGDAFIALHGTKPVVPIGRARTRAMAWLRGEVFDESKGEE